MLVVCCWLRVDCCLWFGVCGLMIGVRCLVFVVRGLLLCVLCVSGVCRVVCVVLCAGLFDVCCLMCVV